MKIKIILITLILLLVGGAVSAQSLWFSDDDESLEPVENTWGLKIPSLTNCDTIDTDANGVMSCGTDASGAGGSPIILDLADDGSNESTDLTEIAITGDTNSIFSEPAADKLLIAVGNDWPKADTADDLTCTDCINATEIEDIYVLIAGDTMTGRLTVTETSAGALQTQVRYLNSSNTVGTGGRLSFRMLDSNSAVQTYGRIGTEIDVNTAGSEDGTMRLSVFEDGSASDYLILNGNTGVVSTSKALTVTGVSTLATTSITALTVSGTLTIPNNSVDEADIAFSTACGAGNHYYLNGNDLACEADANTQLSQATVEDYAGGLWTGNTETLITVTYQGGDNTLDAVVNDDLSLYDNTTSSFITSSALTNYMQDEDINTFAELQSWVSDETIAKLATTTDTKVCTWNAGLSAIQCESSAGADTFASFEIDGASQTAVAPTFDFDGTTFSIVEDPADSFDININKGNLTEATSSVLTITGGASALLSAATIEVDTDLHNWSWANVVDADITNTLTCSTCSGNAGTATALAANGANATSGWAIIGVDASGAYEGAFDAWTEAENTAAAYIDNTVATLSSLTSIGTIGTGIWQATDVGTAYGGTGQSWNAVATGSIPYFSATGVMSTLAAATSTYVLTSNGAAVAPTWQASAGGGAPTDANYLVGTANGSLSAEIVVGTSPGGELGGTWASPTLDHDALDDQYYDSEADLTGLLDDNYEAELNNSAGLLAALSDETGTGLAVFGTSPTITTPTIATSIDLPAGAINTATEIAADIITHTQIADADQADTKCIWFEDPTAADDFKSLWANKTANDFLLTEIWAESDQTVTFMLQVDDGTPADVDSVDLAPAAGEAEDTSLDGDTTVAAGEELDLVIASVSGTPTWVSICFTGNWVD